MNENDSYNPNNVDELLGDHVGSTAMVWGGNDQTWSGRIEQVTEDMVLLVNRPKDGSTEWRIWVNLDSVQAVRIGG